MKKRKRYFIISFTILTLIAILATTTYFVIQSQNAKKVAKENELYNEKNKISSITIKPIRTANVDGTVTIQQGNLYAYVDTKLKKTPENNGNFRTTYGIDETVVLVAQFDKLIESASDCYIIIKFGDNGESRELYGTVKGSTIEFKYTLTENSDNGKMNVIALTGSITDNDSNNIQIGLPQNGIQYTQANYIVADTIQPSYEVTEDKDVDGNIIVDFKYNEKLYIKNNNTLTEINEDNLIKNFDITFQPTKDEKGFRFHKKGNIEILKYINEYGTTEIECKYIVNDGDYGYPRYTYRNLCDIAGNSTWDGGYGSNEIEIEAKKETPFVESVNITSNGIYYNDDGFTYCNEGKEINIEITYNEKVYSYAYYDFESLQEIYRELTIDNAQDIQIALDEGDNYVYKNAKCEEISSNGKTIRYKYIVEKGDNGQIRGINIAAENVYDNAGHPSNKYSELYFNSEIMSINASGVKYIIDTTPPSVEQIIVNSPSDTSEILKAGQPISLSANFSEDVKCTLMDIGFDGNKKEVNLAESSTSYTNFINFSAYTIQNGDNGKLQCFLTYEDKAGNEVSNLSEGIDVNLYTDTEGPNITINSNTSKTNKSIVEYTFDITDNSDNWDISTKGLAEGTFTVDDIDITNGKIVDYKTDFKNNITSIDVLADNDGKQRIYVGKGKISDSVGNLNNNYAIKDDVVIDTCKPEITYVEKSPSTWTNGSVELTIYATDNMTGVNTYIYNNNIEQDNNKFTVDENSTIHLNVRDSAGNDSKTTDVIVNNIDKTQPVLKVIKEDDNLLNIQAEDTESGLARCEVNGTEIVLDEEGYYTYTVQENGYYIITAKDNAGNVNSQTITVDSIKTPDTTPPEVNIIPSTMEWTNQNVKLKVDAKDNESGIRTIAYKTTNDLDPYHWDTIDLTGEWSFEARYNCTYRIEVYDNANNFTEKQFCVKNIDKVKPQIEVNNQSNVLSITVRDQKESSDIAGCEIDGIKISLNKENDENAFIKYTGTFTATENKQYSITAWDNAGNTSTVYSEKAEIPDTTPPEVNIIPSTMEWTNQNVKLKVDAKDNESGIRTIAYKTTNDLDPYHWDTIDLTGEWSFEARYNCTYRIEVYDNANNFTEKQFCVKNIDKVKPQIEVNNQSNVLSITVRDQKESSDIAGCEIDGIKISLNKENDENAFIKYTGTFTATENKQYSITAWDNAGNTSTVYSEKAEIPDTTPPEVNIIPSTMEWTNQNVKLKVDAKDSESGIQSIAYISENDLFGNPNNWKFINLDDDWSFEATYNDTYHIDVYDNADNLSEIKFCVNNIDKIKPQIEVNNQGNVLSVTVRDQKQSSDIAGCEIDGIKISLNKENDENAFIKYTGTFTATENKQYSITAWDNARNMKTETTQVTSIREEPYITIDDDVKTEERNGTKYIILSKPTMADKLKGQMESNYEIKIKNKELTEESTGNLKTGDVVVLEGTNDEIKYKICVKGDINGDEKITNNDIFKLNKYRLGKSQLEVEEWFAGDVNSDGTINMMDIFQINKYRLGIIENF